ncbi:hypothetical protein [Priestia megaterium]|uniref:Uncharacterized protein n=1 Tax=Priestia megaterium TaxID=1404 RepID=A0A6M6EAD8_PRIMG|nr:hypothetical protein [Priestia megaterium]QJX81338.1 hypothetical protein FDZ14_35100 [Priestia megaterium]
MNRKKLPSYIMLFLPWLTIPFVGKKSFIRFASTASLANLFIILLSIIARRKRWWKNKNPMFPNGPDFSYILGPHFVTTLWVFKLTYGSFPKYLITNIVLDWINTFFLARIWERYGFFKFKKVSSNIYWGINIILAIILYGYHYTLEKVINNKKFT